MIDKVRLPATVAEQLEEVRRGGLCNMLDRPCVHEVADDLGHHELVVWIEEHRREYGSLILRGFEVEPVSGGR